jgi:hypothetical protein
LSGPLDLALLLQSTCCHFGGDYSSKTCLINVRYTDRASHALR